MARNAGLSVTAKLCGRLERSVPVAKIHTHVCGAHVGRDRVQLAVAVHIPQQYGLALRTPQRVSGRRLERAVAVSNPHVKENLVHRHHVGLAITVQVPSGHGVVRHGPRRNTDAQWP